MIYMQIKTLREVFFWPVVLGTLMFAGLMIALLRDGLLEQLSILLLSVPTMFMIYIYFFTE
jgi:hypothetical protein